MSRSLRRVVAATIGLATFFGLWELLVRVGDVPSFYLRPPTEFFRFLFTSEVDFFSATLQTATKALAGLLVALVIGFTFGAMMSASRWFDEAAQPVLVFLQITPWIAYISAVVGWLGGGYPPALFMSTLVCLPVFAFASAQGLSAADPATVEVMHSVEATRWQIIRHLRLPNALPALFTAARLATGLSIAAVYFTEGGALDQERVGPHRQQRDRRPERQRPVGHGDVRCGNRSCRLAGARTVGTGFAALARIATCPSQLRIATVSG